MEPVETMEWKKELKECEGKENRRWIPRSSRRMTGLGGGGFRVFRGSKQSKKALFFVVCSFLILSFAVFARLGWGRRRGRRAGEGLGHVVLTFGCQTHF